MKNIFCLVAVVIFAYISARCSTAPSCLSITPPVIQMTGNKTVIENQIIGEYKELEKDAWVVSSVKTTVQKSKSDQALVEGDEELFRALKIREFHAPDIREFKKEGSIGEANTGYIEYKSIPKYESDKPLKELLMVKIEEENKARKTMFKRSLARTAQKEPAETEITGMGKIFAEDQAAKAEVNDWIQEKSGRWVRKK